MSIAIIGGSGFEMLPIQKNAGKTKVATPFGEVKVETGNINSSKVVFLSRHGGDHSIAPHKINYRANIYALKELNVKYIIATAVVGSINKQIKPGDLAILSDFIDATKGRPLTFFEDKKVVHIDMTNPYDKKLSAALERSIKSITGKQSKRAVYVCTEGPRFETKAEIKMFKNAGADVVGMTNVPEVVLANELNIPYASIALSTNFACGISKNILTVKEIIQIVDKKKDIVLKIIEDLIRKISA